MKLKFDKNQLYQLEAIQSIVDLFKGQHLNSFGSEFTFPDSENDSIKLSQAGIGNKLTLSKAQLLENLIRVQTNNQLSSDEISTVLEKLRFNRDVNETGSSGIVSTDFPNYSVEMETGTGKTYVYLRSIYELSKVYGYKKFLIVVPSVAIREGVLKSLQITFDHFREIYENETVEFKVYDSRGTSELRNFAISNAVQILVINIDSFTKDINIINQVREIGIKPIEYVQNSNPIVIIDEPQNMETDVRKRAIASLNPLFTLRFSATHKSLYNLVYKLDPVKAYDLGLVKQIEVDSVVAKNDDSGAYISVDGFKLAKQSITALLTIFVNDTGGVKKKKVKAKIGDDIYILSKGCGVYKTGFIVNELDVENGCVVFSNGQTIYKGQATGGLTDQILRAMIDATVENHFKKERKLKDLGIKVLSIFFIDRVANYRIYNDRGESGKGKFALWFEESFANWQKIPGYHDLYSFSAEDAHNGYFSQDKGKMKDSREGKPTKADDEVFKLIMQDKERLLDLTTPLRFIFSHSALREGWDNPNVFQICTLNETRSEIKKRQEIGRGLRLCVDQSGARNLDRSVNRLTVIANEAYDSFAKKLQSEIEEDCGVKFEGRIKNARALTKVQLKDKWLQDSLFLELWDKMKQCTTYKVWFDSQQLIDNCVAAINAMPSIKKPIIYREKNMANFKRDDKGKLLQFGGEQKGSDENIIKDAKYDIPDIATFIQSKTELTRDTITKILLSSDRLGEVFNNPQLFMDTVVQIIKNELERIKLNGIQYERISGQEYEMKLFEPAEIEQYLDNLIEVKKRTKTLYNYISIDSLSLPEKKFAEDCDSREDILFYVKLPKTFQINTPIGPYNPDWALIKKEDGEESKIYFVTANGLPQRHEGAKPMF